MVQIESHMCLRKWLGSLRRLNWLVIMIIAPEDTTYFQAHVDLLWTTVVFLITNSHLILIKSKTPLLITQSFRNFLDLLVMLELSWSENFKTKLTIDAKKKRILTNTFSDAARLCIPLFNHFSSFVLSLDTRRGVPLGVQQRAREQFEKMMEMRKKE